MRVEVYVPVQIGKLIAEAQAKFGVTKKQVVVAALVQHFVSTGQHNDVRELMKLARTWLARQVNGT